MLFYVSEFVVICYYSNRKLIKVVIVLVKYVYIIYELEILFIFIFIRLFIKWYVLEFL